MSIRWGGRGAGHISRWPKAARRWAPFNLFMSGADGAWFPTSDLTALFTDNVGSTQVAANDDTIGLVLDKHLMRGLSASAFIAAQPELLTNGDFGTGSLSGWTDNSTGTGTTSYSVGAMRAVGTNGSNIGRAYQQIAVTVGAFYQLSWTGATASGSATIGVGTTNTSSSVAAAFVGSGGSRIFLATASTLYVRVGTDSGGGDITVDNISLKAVLGNHEAQSTASFRPKYKTATISRKYDGSDDLQVGTSKLGSSGNSLAVKITAPATVAATQCIAGLQASTSTRFYLALNTSGQLCAGVGTDGTATIVGTTDVRGLTGAAVLIEDGTNVYLYWNGALEYSAARNGTPSTTPVYYEGALNNNGTAASFYSGEIFDRVAIQRGITAAEVAQVTLYMNTH